MGAVVEGPSGDVRGAERIDFAIELGNDAMLSRDDVARAVRLSLSRQIDYDSMHKPLMAGDEAPIIDGNGNTVGRWWCS